MDREIALLRREAADDPRAVGNLRLALLRAGLHADAGLRVGDLVEVGVEVPRHALLGSTPEERLLGPGVVRARLLGPAWVALADHPHRGEAVKLRGDRLRLLEPGDGSHGWPSGDDEWPMKFIRIDWPDEPGAPPWREDGWTKRICCEPEEDRLGRVLTTNGSDHVVGIEASFPVAVSTGLWIRFASHPGASYAVRSVDSGAGIRLACRYSGPTAETDAWRDPLYRVYRTAIGHGAVARDDSIAIGSAAHASPGDAVAIGRGARAEDGGVFYWRPG